jgi:hypothetical protein
VLPATVSQAVVADEKEAITAWADRHGWTLTFEADGLSLDAATTHPATETAIVFHADLGDYPALPPVWTCRNEAGEETLSAFPKPGTQPGISASIFHGGGFICAPWSRKAYASEGGPHQQSEWTMANWRTAGPGYTHAETLADMLDQLRLHLAASPGSMA